MNVTFASIINMGNRAKEDAKRLAQVTEDALKAIKAGDEDECLKQLQEAEELSKKLNGFADKLYSEQV